MLGLIEIGAAKMRPLPGHAGEIGKARKRQVHLARRAAELVPAHALDDLRRKLLRIDKLCEGEPRVEPGDHDVGLDLLAARQRHPRDASAAHDHPLHRRAGSDLSALRPRRARDGLADRAGPALLEPPRAKRPVDLAHVVVKEHVRRARRARAQERPDDPARRLGGLERVELEPLVEIVRAAHGHQLVERVEPLPTERAEVAAQLQEPRQISRRERSGIRRHHAQDWLHGHRHVVHEASEDDGGVGVPRGMAAQLAPRLVGIGPRSQIVAVVERRDGALERENLEAVPRQIEIADDLGAEQAHDVGEDRELETGKYLLGHRRAADHGALL